MALYLVIRATHVWNRDYFAWKGTPVWHNIRNKINTARASLVTRSAVCTHARAHAHTFTQREITVSFFHICECWIHSSHFQAVKKINWPFSAVTKCPLLSLGPLPSYFLHTSAYSKHTRKAICQHVLTLRLLNRFWLYLLLEVHTKGICNFCLYWSVTTPYFTNSPNLTLLNI
jgi:hypothetical protein